MSATLYRNGGLEPPETTDLTTTSAFTLLTGLTTYIKVVEAIILANIDPTNPCIVKLEWVDETPTGHTFWNKEVAAKDTIIIDTIPMLVSGRGKVRSIRATASVANYISATVITSAQGKESPLAA